MILRTITFYKYPFMSMYPFIREIKFSILTKCDYFPLVEFNTCNKCKNITNCNSYTFNGIDNPTQYSRLVYCLKCHDDHIVDYQRTILQVILNLNVHLIKDITWYIFTYLLVQQ